MTKVCSKCGKEKDGSEFSKSEPHSKGLNSWCKECMAIYHKTHNATPEMVAKRRAKQSTQEFKDARRERNATTEAKASRKEYLDRYNATPEAIAIKRAARNTPETKETKKVWNKSPRGKLSGRNSNLKKNYPGFTHDKYVALLTSQGGHCAICPATEPGGSANKHFHIDHDHSCCPGKKTCGKCIRGLLCSRCNTAIGLLDDDPVRLTSAINYLNRPRIDIGSLENLQKEI